MFLLTFLGIVLLVALLALLFVPIRTEDEYYQQTQREKDLGYRPELKGRKSPAFLVAFAANMKLKLILFAVAIFLLLSNWLFFYSVQGNQYYLVYPTGGWATHYDPGFKWRGFARIQEWQKEVDIKVVTEDESTDGIEGVITDKVTFTVTDAKGAKSDMQVPGIPITFIDRVHAAVRISVRLTMPQDPPMFRKLAESFKSQTNIINNTLIPTIREQLSNTGYQFAAQDYISGAATDFRQAIDDQLKSGGYSTERKEFHDTVYAALQEKGARVIREINTRYRIIRNVDKAGKLIRIPHEITKNGVFVSQVIVDGVDPEPAFKQRLEAQRDISAQKRIEMEKIETAKAEQQRIIAEGERDKSKERVEKEKDQVGRLIEIETQVKQEESKRALAAIALQTAELDAKKVKVNADAKRYEIQNADGLSEEVRAKLANDLEKTKALADAIKTANWPTTFISGGGNGKESDLLTQLIGAELAKKMINKE